MSCRTSTSAISVRICIPYIVMAIGSKEANKATSIIATIKKLHQIIHSLIEETPESHPLYRGWVVEFKMGLCKYLG